jgi:fucose permease
MSFALARMEWNYGYLIVSVIQILLSIVIFMSLPVWKKGISHAKSQEDEAVPAEALPFREIFAIPGAVPCFLTFFCYCSLELTTSLWASSFLVEKWQFTPEVAAGFGSMFYLGITAGRFTNGFLAMKWSDHFLIRLGVSLVAVGIVLLWLPFHRVLALAGFLVIGLGCAPIYPCIIHMTPNVFGKDKSQAMIGIQMAFAYTGFLVMPTLFGVIAEHISIGLLPVYLLAFWALMVGMHEAVARRGKKRN